MTETGVPASRSGCQPSASATDASSQSGIPNAVEQIANDRTTLLCALNEARLQLIYLDERYPTGTTPSAIARIDHVLASALPWSFIASAIRTAKTEEPGPNDDSANAESGDAQ